MRKALPTPREMIAHLDKYIRGQDAAKRVLSKAVYFHYLKGASDEKRTHVRVPEHVLLIGPTGCGKTHLVQTLAKYLEVPLLFCNASSLTAEGYVGESVGDMLARLSRLCGDDPFLEKRAIVFLDEFDKLAAGGPERGEIGTVKVQHELLAVLDGNKMLRVKDSGSTPNYDIDTSKILFIAGGAFSGIEKIVRRRTGAFGFSSQGSEAEAAEKNAPDILPEDVRQYGFIPELVGRFTNVTALKALDENDLYEILSTRAQSPLSVHQNLYRLHGVDLRFTKAALQKIARKAHLEKEGARALRRILGNVLTELDWRVPDYRSEGVSAIRIGEECVQGTGAPELLRGGRKIADHGERLRREIFQNPEHEVDERKKAETPGDGFGAARECIGWQTSRGSCRKWWRALEDANKESPETVLSLAHEIKQRGGDLAAYFLAYVESTSDDPSEVLDHMEKFTMTTLPGKPKPK